LAEKKTNKSVSEGKTGSGGYRTKDGTYVPFKSFEKAGAEIRAKRADAGRALADADKKTRANVKEEIEQVEELKASTYTSYADKREKDVRSKTIVSGSKEHQQWKMVGKARDKAAQKLHRGGHMTPSMAREEVEQVDEIKKPVGYIEKASASYGAVTMAKGETDPGTSSHERLSRVQKNRREGIKRAMTKEEAEQVDEKLAPEAKSAVRTALGPKTPGNQMRKSSQAARTLITVLKSNKKNVADGTK
jgi:hypothetical protein